MSGSTAKSTRPRQTAQLASGDHERVLDDVIGRR
jgi:hypothetical protein